LSRERNTDYCGARINVILTREPLGHHYAGKEAASLERRFVVVVLGGGGGDRLSMRANFSEQHNVQLFLHVVALIALTNRGGF
jgi:hypothetical protein